MGPLLLSCLPRGLTGVCSRKGINRTLAVLLSLKAFHPSASNVCLVRFLNEEPTKPPSIED